MKAKTKTIKNIVLLFVLISAVCIHNSSFSAVSEEVTDYDIRRAVERQLAADNAVGSHLIDIEIENGVVIVSGPVDNILAAERALKIIRSVKGVRAIINKIEVTPVTRKDHDILADVRKALINDTATDSYEISVEVENGVVTLAGNVDSWPEKQFAASAAKGVRGVKGVVNDLSIEYREVRPDHEIEADVIRRLRSDLYINDSNIDVTVEGGIVTLSGKVGSLAEKHRASAYAHLNGVMEVNDDMLKVDVDKKDELSRKAEFVLKSDEEMEKDLKAAFYYDPRLYNFEIDVSVKNGIATLTGEVDSLKAKNTATEDARNTLGIWKVKNHLKVRPTVMPEDTQLALKIEDSLERDPYLERHDISFVIRNYKVYLYGKVDDYFEKDRAEDIISRIPGVVVIDNMLKVNGNPWEWKDDLEIRSDIESELFWDVFVDSDDITVKVENGIVTLSGTVDTWQESKAAMENALEGGARAVINHLRIKEIPEL